MSGRNDYIFFLFLLLLLFVLFSGHVGGDAIYNYYTSQSIFRDGNLDLSDGVDPVTESRLSGPFTAVAGAIERKSEEQGRFYSKYGFANIIAGTAFYGIGLLVSFLFPFLPGGTVIVFFFALQNILFVSLMGVVFLRICRSIVSGSDISAIVSAGLVFGTMFVTYAVKSGFGEPLAALLIVIALYCYLMYEWTGRPLYLFFSGVTAGACILSKVYLFIVYPAFAFLLFSAAYDRNIWVFAKKSLYPAAGFLFPLFVFFIYNYARFGGILETGYYSGTPDTAADSETVFSMFYFGGTIYNLLFSSGKGIFLFNPLILLSLFGLKSFFRQNRRLFIFYLLIIIPYFGFFGFSSHWASYGAWGARYFVPVIPVLILPVLFLFTRKDSSRVNIRGKKRLLIGVIALGTVVQLPSILMNFSALERFYEKESPYLYYTRIGIPYYSQVYGCYYLLFSGVNKKITGRSLDYPIIEYGMYLKPEGPEGKYRDEMFMTGITRYRSLEGYDWFDIWILHVMSLKTAGGLIKSLGVILYLLCCFAAGWTGVVYLRHGRPESAGS